MNLTELRAGLKQLNDADFKKFVSEFGGDFQEPEGVVRAFVDDPKLERRLCQLLGLATEEEKMVQATMSAAYSAKLSVIAATIATVIALIALGVTIYSLFK